ncbi:MAG: cytochrome c oxidase subunit 3, partial [Myxococcales bacterium]|nr:cytochrome c oxidase subunit 3 [Myxococcales bacterium]
YSHKIHEGLLWGSHFAPHADALAELGTASPAHRLHLFFSIYYVMTGLHGLHVIAGIVAYGWLFVRAAKGHFDSTYYGPVDNVALYWHLVDLVWIFLFPLLYLVR